MRKMVRTKRYCRVYPDSSTLRAMMTAMQRMRVAQCCYYVQEFVAADPAEMIVRTKVLYALYFSPRRPSILFTSILRIITLRICVHLTIKKHPSHSHVSVFGCPMQRSRLATVLGIHICMTLWPPSNAWCNGVASEPSRAFTSEPCSMST